MSLAIRPATADDLDALAPLFDAYRVFYSQPSDLPRARDFLEQRLARAQSAVLLAHLEGSAAGFTQLYPLFSSVRTAPVWLPPLPGAVVSRTGCCRRPKNSQAPRARPASCWKPRVTTRQPVRSIAPPAGSRTKASGTPGGWPDHRR
jgi:hypothetical protein